MTELRDEEAKKRSADSLCRTKGSENDRVAGRKSKKKVVRFFVPGKLGGSTIFFAPGLQKALGGPANSRPKPLNIVQ